jgi:hypothetical protein
MPYLNILRSSGHLGALLDLLLRTAPCQIQKLARNFSIWIYLQLALMHLQLHRFWSSHVDCSNLARTGNSFFTVCFSTGYSTSDVSPEADPSLIFKEEKFPSTRQSHLRDSGRLEKDGHDNCLERRDQNRPRWDESQWAKQWWVEGHCSASSSDSNPVLLQHLTFFSKF